MPTFLKPLARLMGIALAAFALWAASDRIGYNPEPWLADLHALEDSAARGYANLEWQVAQGVVDPVRLHRRTDSLVRTAGSRSRASAALREFAAAFHDGHFSVRPPKRRVVRWLEDLVTGRKTTPPSVTEGPASACAALGYRDDRRPSNLTAHPAYQSLDGTTPFETGLLTVAERKIGVIRIDAFGVQRFGASCALAWSGAAAHDSAGACGEDCRDALWQATSDTLLAQMRRAIGQVDSAGAHAVLIDLTGNGGGNDWVAAAARQFTAVPLSGHHAGVVRQPHHREALLSAVAALTEARDATTDDRWRGTLDSALATAHRQLDAVAVPCDRRGIWTSGVAALTCSQLATEAFTTGFLPYLGPDARRAAGADVAFGPAGFHYVEAVWQGPVVMLVDHRTASASEEFAVSLRDNGAATVIGERTFGAGCGHTSGGIGFALAHSGLEVQMPDCARIRNNGMNEVSGIEPDVPTGWKESDPANVRLEKTMRALRAALERDPGAAGVDRSVAKR